MLKNITENLDIYNVSQEIYSTSVLNLTKNISLYLYIVILQLPLLSDKQHLYHYFPSFIQALKHFCVQFVWVNLIVFAQTLYFDVKWYQNMRAELNTMFL